MSQDSPSLVNHKIYGLGSIVAMNTLEDQSLRLCIVWKDVEQANVLAGWYIFNEMDFIKEEK